MKFYRFKGECYYDEVAKQNVIKIKSTFFGRLFPKYTLICKDDFEETSTIEWR